MADTLKGHFINNVNYNHLSKGLIVPKKIDKNIPVMSFKTTNRVKLIRYYENGERCLMSNHFQRSTFTSCGLGYMYNQIIRIENLFGQKTTYLQFGNPYIENTSISKYSHNRTNTEHSVPALNNSALQSRLVFTNNIIQYQTREPVKQNENFTVSFYGFDSLLQEHERENEKKQKTKQKSSKTLINATDTVQRQMMLLFNMSFNKKNKRNHEFPGTSTQAQQGNKYFLMQYHRCNRLNIQKASFVNIKNHCSNAAIAIGNITRRNPTYEIVMNILDIFQDQFPTKKQKIKACYILVALTRVYDRKKKQIIKYNRLERLKALEKRMTIDFLRLVFRCICVLKYNFYFKKKKNSFNTNGGNICTCLKYMKRPCLKRDVYLGHIKDLRGSKLPEPIITSNNGCEPYDFCRWLLKI